MIRTQVLKHLPGARLGERGGSKENFRGGTTARGVMEKSRYVRVMEGRKSEKITQSNTSTPQGSEVPFECQKG